jgi:hypothetical protein
MQYRGLDLSGLSVLNICCGSCDVSGAAARLGTKTVAIDIHPIPVLIGNAELRCPACFGDPSALPQGIAGDGKWAGLKSELDYWANELILTAKANAGERWLEGTKATKCCKAYKCQAYSLIGTLKDRASGGTGCFSLSGRHAACLDTSVPYQGTNASPVQLASRWHAFHPLTVFSLEWSLCYQCSDPDPQAVATHHMPSCSRSLSPIGHRDAGHSESVLS